MTGFGSPCGACKFLRRKCARGCVFAPYFSHEQGAEHFAAIHKVFGASNVSKLLMHLPVTNRCEAAVTISYEAQARVHDPIYGCVAHIFALQREVVNLQTQLASLKSQAAQGFANGSTISSGPQEEKLYNKFPPCQQFEQGFFQAAEARAAQFSASNSLMNADAMLHYDHGLVDSNCIRSSENYNPHSNIADENISFSTDDDSSCSIGPPFHDMEDLQSVAFAYLRR